MTIILRRLLFFIALIATWEIIYRINQATEWFSHRFPSPGGVVDQLYVGLFDSGILLYAWIASMERIFIGFGLAVIIGTILGIILARSKVADETLGSLVIALQTIPSIVWLPIALMLFQGGNIAIFFVVVLGGTWPMTQNMRMGVKNVQPILVKAARTMGYSGLSLVWKVMIPASIPAALAGVRLAWAFSWRALMAAELLSRGGLGRTLMDARDFFNYDLVIAIMVVISFVGLIMEYFVFNQIEKRVMARWGLSKTS